MDEVLYSNTLLLYTAILPFQLIHLINPVADLTLNFMSHIHKNSSGLAQKDILQATTICIDILL